MCTSVTMVTVHIWKFRGVGTKIVSTDNKTTFSRQNLKTCIVRRIITTPFKLVSPLTVINEQLVRLIFLTAFK